MELCILIPAKDEDKVIAETILKLHEELWTKLNFNILIVNDHSTDNTNKVVNQLASKFPWLNIITNELEGGVGNAIKFGLEYCKGDIVAICMADGSDSPDDIFTAFNKVKEEGYDCVFGSRFIKGGHVENYPLVKLILNRTFNNFVRLLTLNPYNDYTNIFKVYHKRALKAIMPLSSTGFSIGLEMSLKAYKQKLKIAIIPISWIQRKAGKSKLKLRKNIITYFSTLSQNLKNESQ